MMRLGTPSIRKRDGISVVVPMRRFRRQAAFDPAAVSILISAYEAALERLSLKDQCTISKERLARTVIEIACDGEEDPLTICDQALSALRLPAGI